MSRARVLWVIKGLGPGGAERLLAASARVVDTERFDYEAVYLLPWKDHLGPAIRDAGVPVSCLGVRHATDPSWVLRLRSRIRDGRFDLVHAHLPTSAIGARLAVRSLGVRRPAMVTTEHNTWDRYRKPTRWANAATYPLNDRGIAVSHAVLTSMSARARARTQVIPNGIDLDATVGGALDRDEARRALGIHDDRPLVGTIGGVSPKKGQLDLVRAAAHVRRTAPDATFVFVGLEVASEAVREEVNRAGLGDAVVFAGYRPDAACLLSAFDAYCLPSRHEGMPLSLIEAMAVGLPVVATAVGGSPELVRDGVDGRLVPARNPIRLAEALVEVLSDAARARELGAAAALSAREHDLTRMVRAVESVYADALRRR